MEHAPYVIYGNVQLFILDPRVLTRDYGCCPGHLYADRCEAEHSQDSYKVPMYTQ